MERSRKRLDALLSSRIIDVIGVEYALLRQCDGRTKTKFYIAGISIIIITIITFCSLFYAFNLLFNNLVVEVLIALFVSFVFLNIYILLLSTFSKKTLTFQQQRSVVNMSNVSRIGFVIFIAFIISKPIEIYVLRKKLDGEVSLHRRHLVDVFIAENDQLFSQDISSLDRQKLLLKKEISFDSVSGIERINKINDKVNSLNSLKRIDEQRIISGINQSEFFVLRVKHADGRYPVSWVICFIVIIFFLLPGYLVYSISGQNQYYKLKHEGEREAILNDYRHFKLVYSRIFFLKFGLNHVNFYEVYNDAPFNTELRQGPTYQSQKDFLKKTLYS